MATSHSALARLASPPGAPDALPPAVAAGAGCGRAARVARTAGAPTRPRLAGAVRLRADAARLHAAESGAGVLPGRAWVAGRLAFWSLPVRRRPRPLTRPPCRPLGSRSLCGWAAPGSGARGQRPVPGGGGSGDAAEASGTGARSHTARLRRCATPAESDHPPRVHTPAAGRPSCEHRPHSSAPHPAFASSLGLSRQIEERKRLHALLMEGLNSDGVRPQHTRLSPTPAAHLNAVSLQAQEAKASLGEAAPGAPYTPRARKASSGSARAAPRSGGPTAAKGAGSPGPAPAAVVTPSPTARTG